MNRINATKHFSVALNESLQKKFGYLPSSSFIAKQFNLRAKGTSTITRQSARKWLKGESFPDPGRLTILVEWLDLEPNSIIACKDTPIVNEQSISALNLDLDNSKNLSQAFNLVKCILQLIENHKNLPVNREAILKAVEKSFLTLIALAPLIVDDPQLLLYVS